MPKSVNSVAAKARRKKILKAAKGYFGRRKNVHTVAKNAVEKAMQYAYRDRKNKKRTLNFFCRSFCLNPAAFYKQYIHVCKS